VDAVRELRLATADIERTSETIRLEERRSAFLEDKWPVYARLALAERARGSDAEAFAVSERLRARQMLDMMARGRIAPIEPDDSTRLREQDLRRRIAELTQGLIAAGSGSGSTLRGVKVAAGQLDAMREALDSAQRGYSALLLEMKERSPDYTRLVAAETIGWQEVAARLAPDEALIEYLVSDSTTVAFVVTAGGIASVDLHASRRELARLVAFARANLARPHDAASLALWRASLRRLYQDLIAPVEPYLQGKQTLIIAPHGELHYLPFAALVIPAASVGATEQFLVERYVLAYTPSASVWVKHAARPGSVSHRVLALAPREGALPASRDEVEAIGRLYGSRATVLTGAAATEYAFRLAAPDAEIIHLATSGVLNKRNPLFSFVELAPANGDDGRLEVHEALALSLRARLVVLSACQTAASSGTLGDVPTGEDWVGLVQSFFIAGAANVLGTLWPVEDRATARLMEGFYGALTAVRSVAEALAVAQRAALRDNALAHPFYWAGLSIFVRREREL
jgi:CHAT domain-containing protein